MFPHLLQYKEKAYNTITVDTLGTLNKERQEPLEPLVEKEKAIEPIPHGVESLNLMIDKGKVKKGQNSVRALDALNLIRYDSRNSRRSYSGQRNLPAPVDSEEGQPSSKKVVCDLCGKTMTRGRLKTHKIDVHFKSGKYECDMCPRRFAVPSDFKRHVDSHGDDYQACQLCGDRFKQQCTLWKHMKTHTVEKNWRCEVC